MTDLVELDQLQHPSRKETDAHSDKLACDILEKGYGVDQLQPDIVKRVEMIFSTFPDFVDNKEKLPKIIQQSLITTPTQSRVQTITGFRSPGQEHAKTDERPDIMETFSILDAEKEKLPKTVWDFLESNPLTKNLLIIKKAVANNARKMLMTIARSIHSANPEFLEIVPHLDFEKYSHIQVNLYRPKVYEEKYKQKRHALLADREYLMDPHEDAQFLTWVTANALGLVGRSLGSVNKSFQLVKSSSHEMFVMPSLPFTYFTGGPNHGGVPAYEHAVLSAIEGRKIGSRISLLVAVNPDISRKIPMLRLTNENKDFSMPLIIAESVSKAFGLPKFADLEALEPIDKSTYQKTIKLINTLY